MVFSSAHFALGVLDLFLAMTALHHTGILFMHIHAHSKNVSEWIVCIDLWWRVTLNNIKWMGKQTQECDNSTRVVVTVPHPPHSLRSRPWLLAMALCVVLG